jgi:hypothetical protein
LLVDFKWPHNVEMEVEISDVRCLIEGHSYLRSIVRFEKLAEIQSKKKSYDLVSFSLGSTEPRDPVFFYDRRGSWP